MNDNHVHVKVLIDCSFIEKPDRGLGTFVRYIC